MLNVVFPVVLLLAGVEGQDNRDLAESHFNTGQAAYQRGAWDVAAIEFEAAYQLSHEPDLLYNLSKTAEQQGKLTESLRYARQYLTEKGAAIAPKDADEVRGRIARLVSLLQPGSAAAAPAAAPPQPAAAPTPSESKPSRTIPNAFLIGGGVLTVGGIGCLAGAWATGQAARDSALTYQQWAELGDRGRALNAAGLALTITGGSLVAAGAIWRIVGAKK